VDHPLTHRFRALDSLRGICACIVVLLHVRTQGVLSNSAFVQHGFLFVDFFFVLSGFVIANAYGEKIARGFSLSRFMFLRLARVYPLHLLMLGLFFTFELCFAILAPEAASRRPFTGSNNGIMLVANLLLMQIFVGPDQTSWNGPSWSIAAEFWAYLVFGLAFSRIWKFIVPACIAVAGVAASFLYFRTDRYINVFHDGAFARCALGFALGVTAQHFFCAEIDKRRGKTSFAEATLLEVFVTAFVTTLVRFAGAGPWSLLCPLAFLLAIVVFASEGGAISKFLLTRPFLLVGNLSYSIYMVHGFVYYRFVNVLEAMSKIIDRPLTVANGGSHEIGGGPLFGDLMTLTVLGISIAFATFTYQAIERPSQLWSRRRQDTIFGRLSTSNPKDGTRNV
jgi:peptidoglycan/LPS O-acetylase OafA/YrhL